MSKIVAVTDLDSNDIKIGSGTIISVEDLTTSRKIIYSTKGASAKEVLVSEALAAIITEAANLVAVTIEGSDAAINADRILSLAVEGSGSKVFYDFEAMATTSVVTDEDPATIEAAVDLL